MKKIAVLVPDAAKKQEIVEFLQECQEEAIVAVGSMDDGLKKARLLRKQGVEVVVARGGTAELIARECPGLVVVNVFISGFDLVLALEEARHFGDRVAVVAFPSMIKQIESLESVLRVKINKYLIEKPADVAGLISKAMADGAQVVLGGFMAVDQARKQGLACVEIVTGRQAYYEAFQHAKELLRSFEEEKRKAGLLRTVLNHAYEGIISIDNDGYITSINPVAQKVIKYFDLEEKKRIGEICPDLELEQTLLSGKEELNRIYEINGVKVLCRKVPLQEGKSIFGAVATLQDVTKIQMMEARIRHEAYSKGHVAHYHFSDIWGGSRPIRNTIAVAQNYSSSDANILITGKSGTGKEVFAQSIHNSSSRSQGPFVAVNCAALPSQLLESELFGYVGGAFTGANREGKQGLFEMAHLGTIFLDEIGETDLATQGRLLRVLQERVITRLGGDRVIPVNVRVIAATNKDLVQYVAELRFREDLYYRLNVLRLQIPSLCERKKDVAIYAQRFLQEFAGERQLKFSSGALKRLEEHSWPGNVRELRNAVERLAVLASKKIISAAMVEQTLQFDGLKRENHAPPQPENPEMRRIRDALDSCGGRIGDCAKVLQMSRATLWRKMKQLGI